VGNHFLYNNATPYGVKKFRMDGIVIKNHIQKQEQNPVRDNIIIKNGIQKQIRIPQGMILYEI